MSAEVADVGTGEQTSQENLYVMTSQSRGGSDIHMLRSEAEDLGADPESLNTRERQAGQRGERLREAQATASSIEPRTVEAGREQVSERAKVERDLAQIRERLSRPVDYHPAARELDLAWAAELEQSLAEVDAPVAALPEVRGAPTVHKAELPDVKTPTPWSEAEAQIKADQASRDERAAADWDQVRRDQTIREAAEKTKSQSKQAAASTDIKWGQPAAKHEADRPSEHGHQAADHDRRPLYREDHRFNDRRHAEHVENRETSAAMSHKVSDTERRQQARDKIDARGQEIAEATAEKSRQSGPHPPASCHARTPGCGDDRPRLAPRGPHRRRPGALRESRPAGDGREPRAEGGSAGCRHRRPDHRSGQEAQARIQRHLNDLRPTEGRPGSQPFPAAQDKPTGLQGKAQVLTADQAYRDRAERREAWSAKTRAAQAESGRSEGTGHLVEPGAIDRATVVVSDPKDAHSLVRGTSAAAEAHLVTGRPDPTTGYQITQESARFSAQQREVRKGRGPASGRRGQSAGGAHGPAALPGTDRRDPRYTG